MRPNFWCSISIQFLLSVLILLRLLEVNITSLDEIYYSESLLFGKFSEDESFALNKAGQNLLETQDDLENLKLSLWNDLLEESQNGNSWASGL